jgi:VWFA-related protein
MPGAASAFVAPEDFTFRKRVDEVQLLFTVVDRKGKFISNLGLQDLELLDDHRPPEKVHVFQQETDLPLRVALVIDLSGSVTNRFHFEQDAAAMFFKKILRPGDKATIIGFNEKVKLEQDFTNDAGQLKSALKRLKPNGETALFDAVIYAGHQLEKYSEKGTRRMIILISDGDNNGGKAILRDAQEAALRAEAPVYSISSNRKEFYTKGEATLELLSKFTGGEVLPAHEESGIVRAFKQVEQALRSQYVLAYKPSEFISDGRYRELSLNAKKNSLRVEVRRGYYAPKE